MTDFLCGEHGFLQSSQSVAVGIYPERGEGQRCRGEDEGMMEGLVSTGAGGNRCSEKVTPLPPEAFEKYGRIGSIDMMVQFRNTEERGEG